MAKQNATEYIHTHILLFLIVAFLAGAFFMVLVFSLQGRGMSSKASFFGRGYMATDAPAFQEYSSPDCFSAVYNAQYSGNDLRKMGCLPGMPSTGEQWPMQYVNPN